MINTTFGKQEIADSFSIRREALMHGRAVLHDGAGGPDGGGGDRGPRPRAHPGDGAAGRARLEDGGEMSGRIPITASGLRRLKEELKQLQGVERTKISREIEVARGHGDLRENAEYHAAKEKQSHIEGRILNLNDWIARAEVIDVSKLSGDRVVFGATVKLLDVETDKEVTYTLVGELEADIKRRSSRSPPRWPGG